MALACPLEALRHLCILKHGHQIVQHRCMTRPPLELESGPPHLQAGEVSGPAVWIPVQGILTKRWIFTFTPL